MDRRCRFPRLIGRILLSALLCLLLATMSIGATTGVAAARSDTDCSLALRPQSSFVATDPAGSFSLDFDLDANSAATVESTRLVARFRAVQAGFGADSVAEIDAYLDSLVAWYGYLDAPCAAAVPYAGPFTNAPDVPTAAYGFGGVDASTTPAVVIQITTFDSDSTEIARVAIDDGPALAHSGSESFVLAYFGAGLLAFGATALGMKRWMSGPT